MTTELHKTITTLIEYETWRRGKRDHPAPAGIDDALRHATTVLMDVENLLQQKDQANAGIALRAVEIAAGVA